MSPQATCDCNAELEECAVGYCEQLICYRCEGTDHERAHWDEDRSLYEQRIAELHEQLVWGY